jgi:DNA-binding HxlR family transcriptional regulator
MADAPAREEGAFCPVYAALNLLQEKWTLRIVRALLEGPKGFNELSRAIGGVNPGTLSQRLDHLVQLGLVEKTVESYMPPPRTRYRLTPSGEELEAVIQAVDRWARKHLKAPVS